jgi:hypothetical protein
MSTPLPPSAPDDELVNAYLDDELPDTDRRRLEADPGLMARAAELAAVRDAIRSDVDNPGAAQREAAIAAALEAAPAPAPTPLPRRHWPRVIAIAGAAAAVALAVTLVAVTSRHTRQSTSAITVATSGSKAASASEAPLSSLAGSGPSTTAPAVGSAAVAAPNAGPASTPASAAGGTPAAGASINARDQLAALALALADNGSAPIKVCPEPRPGARYRGSFTWRGTPAQLFALLDAKTGRPVLAIAVASSDCHVFASTTVG